MFHKPWRTATFAALFATAPLAWSAEDHSAHHGHGDHVHVGNEPIGVMGAHVHEKGHWMVSYRYMRMEMDGNRDGTSGVSTSEVLDDYMVAPLEMTMDMHMFGAMYAPTDNLTLMAMVPYIDQSMDHKNRMGVEFTTSSSGFSDVKLAGAYRAHRWGSHQLLLNLGISLPTGSTDEEDNTPLGKVRLPYPMQLGSGSYDLLPGVTYLGEQAAWSWGTQLMGTIRTGDNDEDYRLGDRVKLTAWGARKLSPWWSASLRMSGEAWGDIDGEDDKIVQRNPMNVPIVPTADPDLRGGKRIDALAGLRLHPPGGLGKGHSIGLEVGTPVYQDLDGPQLETDWTLMLGIQLSI